MLKEQTRQETNPAERNFLVAYRNQLARELAEVERQLSRLSSVPSRTEAFER